MSIAGLAGKGRESGRPLTRPVETTLCPLLDLADRHQGREGPLPHHQGGGAAWLLVGTGLAPASNAGRMASKLK